MATTRRAFFCGNWKLNGSIAESLALATDVRNGVATLREVDVAVAPSFTAMYAVAKRLEDGPVTVAAQDCFWEEKGAFTGEVSPVAAGRRRLQAGHHRPLGAAAAVRRAGRGGEPEGARGAARRPDADHLRRRDPGRARRRRDHGPRAGAAGRRPGRHRRRRPGARGHRLRAGLGDRHGAQRDPRPRRRKFITSSARASPPAPRRSRHDCASCTVAA